MEKAEAVMEFLAWLAKEVHKYLLGRAAAPKGAEEGTVSTTVMELDSGYSVEAERARNRMKLTNICNYVVTAGEFQPRDGNTYCNLSTKRIAEEMGCFDFARAPMANEMVDILDGSPDWRQDSAERASAHALMGGLAVAAKKYAGHGHIAAVYPMTCQKSGSWGRMVPMVANVGKTNGIMKTSEAFPVADGEPKYYLWKAGEL